MLLERIAAEKQRRVEAGEIRKPKPLAPVADDEKPFETPEAWTWTRLETICTYVQRGKQPKYVDQSDVPVISQKCVQWDRFAFERARFVDESTLGKYKEERFLQDLDLLWNSTGLGTLGRIGLFPAQEVPYETVVADSHVTVIRPALKGEGVLPRYLLTWFSSPLVQDVIESESSGSTKQAELATGTVRSYPVPLPPEAEQRRIAARVNELMALCDRLADRLARRDALRQQWAASTVRHVSDDTPIDGAPAWAFAQTNFDALLATPDDAERTRALMLRLSVTGKLSDSDNASWPQVTLGDVVSVTGGGTPSKRNPEFWEGGTVPWISPKDMKVWDIYDSRDHVTEAAVEGSAAKWIEPGAVLVVVRGMILAHTFPAAILRVPATINQDMKALWPITGVDPEFLLRLIWGLNEDVLDLVETSGHGTKRLPTSSLLGLTFRLPPEVEQRRIVARADELMALCDRMESSLRQRQVGAARLLETTLAEAVTE
ncbi:MAG: restriction endonuclease subunit S [Bacteroidota bacterium]